jgi:hypothetical protein
MAKLHSLRRQKYAKHEIGHVLLSLALERPFESVEIISDTDEKLAGVSVSATIDNLGGSAAGVVRGYGAGMTDREWVIACMAGVAGERVNRKNAGRLTFVDLLMSAENDWRQANEVCTPAHLKMWGYKRSATDVDTYLNECLAVAHDIIVRFKDVHSRLVELLLEKGKLTYQECKEVWDARARLRMDSGRNRGPRT